MMLGIERIKFVGLSLAVKILYAYQTHYNQEVDGGLSVDCTRNCYVTWWVNNINQVLNKKWFMKYNVHMHTNAHIQSPFSDLLSHN